VELASIVVADKRYIANNPVDLAEFHAGRSLSSKKTSALTKPLAGSAFSQGPGKYRGKGKKK